MLARTGDATYMFNVLVTTDNHVGYNEGDQVRGDDAANTFEEIMEIAKERSVDLVLQAGDLFHLNKPSRRSLYRVMQALKENTLGDKPVEFETLSLGDMRAINYEDPNLNIAIPVFGISGNHDDSGGTNMLSMNDILEISGLLNNFGRVGDNEDVVVKPILLRKGDSKLALYGIANVRDERLFRQFRAGRVRFLRAKEQPDDYFSILLLHQNHSGRSTTATNYIPEEVLPNFLDLVIWGHEHECLIEPRNNESKGFLVMQPGSSVATSLIEGEAVAKHIAILRIGDQKNLEFEKIRLKTVRPFAIRTASLRDDSGIDHTSPSAKEEVTEWLMKQVDELIHSAMFHWAQANPDKMEIPLPLVRFKVDYTGGYEIENVARFSGRFVGKVANTSDVLQVFTQKVTQTPKGQAGAVLDALEQSARSRFGTTESRVSLEALVHEFLTNLQVLKPSSMEELIAQYVEKDDKDAIEAYVNRAIEDNVKRNKEAPEELEKTLDKTCSSEDIAEEVVPDSEPESRAEQEREECSVENSPVAPVSAPVGRRSNQPPRPSVAPTIERRHDPTYAPLNVPKQINYGLIESDTDDGFD